jgi:hypothetical protein
MAPTAAAAAVPTRHSQMSATRKSAMDDKSLFGSGRSGKRLEKVKSPACPQRDERSPNATLRKRGAFDRLVVRLKTENQRARLALPGGILRSKTCKKHPCAAGVRGRQQRTKCSVHTQMPLSAKGRGKLKKSSACPERKANASCAGREPSVRRGVTPTSGATWCSVRRGCGCACRLRTGTPAAEPAILCISACRILEALISVLRRRSLEVVSLCCSHQSSKRRQGRHCHHELTHFFLPLSFLVAQPS